MKLLLVICTALVVRGNPLGKTFDPENETSYAHLYSTDYLEKTGQLAAATSQDGIHNFVIRPEVAHFGSAHGIRNQGVITEVGPMYTPVDETAEELDARNFQTAIIEAFETDVPAHPSYVGRPVREYSTENIVVAERPTAGSDYMVAAQNNRAPVRETVITVQPALPVSENRLGPKIETASLLGPKTQTASLFTTLDGSYTAEQLLGLPPRQAAYRPQPLVFKTGRYVQPVSYFPELKEYPGMEYDPEVQYTKPAEVLYREPMPLESPVIYDTPMYRKPVVREPIVVREPVVTYQGAVRREPVVREPMVTYQGAVRREPVVRREPIVTFQADIGHRAAPPSHRFVEERPRSFLAPDFRPGKQAAMLGVQRPGDNEYMMGGGQQLMGGGQHHGSQEYHMRYQNMPIYGPHVPERRTVMTNPAELSGHPHGPMAGLRRLPALQVRENTPDNSRTFNYPPPQQFLDRVNYRERAVPNPQPMYHNEPNYANHGGMDHHHGEVAPPTYYRPQPRQPSGVVTPPKKGQVETGYARGFVIPTNKPITPVQSNIRSSQLPQGGYARGFVIPTTKNITAANGPTISASEFNRVAGVEQQSLQQRGFAFDEVQQQGDSKLQDQHAAATATAEARKLPLAASEATGSLVQPAMLAEEYSPETEEKKSE